MRVLCLAEYYLPGHRAGGPVRSLSSMVEALGSDVDFRIVTRSRDWGTRERYPGIETARWVEVGPASVWYLDEGQVAQQLLGLLREGDYAVLYLNSFFSPLFSVLPMAASLSGALPPHTLLIAPRGELAGAALEFKPLRKRAYLGLARRLGLFRSAWFHAASQEEKDRIARVTSVAPDRILVAPNTWRATETDGTAQPAGPASRAPGPLRIVFLSRISPIKNLDFLMRALRDVRSPVEFTVCGPVADEPYWLECQRLASTLPRHITITFRGAVEHEAVQQEFGKHDVFFFPTRSESFGHVIGEALVAGTPVVTSPHTPWKSDGSQALGTLAIDDTSWWTRAIEEWCRLGEPVLADSRVAARDYASRKTAASDALYATRELFERLGRAEGGSAVPR